MPFWVTNITRITQTGSYLANEPEFATKVNLIIVGKQASPHVLQTSALMKRARLQEN